MASADGTIASPPRTAVAGAGANRAPPRMYGVSPLLVGALPNWDAVFTHAAELGFDAVLLASPFAPGPDGDLRHAGDLDAPHPLFGSRDGADGLLATLVQRAGRSGLALHLDLRLDAAAAGGALSERHPAWFEGPGGVAGLDPRRAPEERGVVRARWDAAAVAPDLLGFWQARLRRWATAGVAGLRCEAPAAVPAAIWRALIADAPTLAFLAWAPGLTPAAVADLRGLGFAAVFDSLAWWDGQAGWFAEEAYRLQAVAPRLCTLEAPFGPRSAADAADAGAAEAAARHRLLLAGACGAGLLLPMGFEHGARRAWDPRRDRPELWAQSLREAPFNLAAAVRDANRLLADQAGRAGRAGGLRPLSGPGAPVTALLRDGPVPTVVLANPDPDAAASIDAAALLPGIGGRLLPVLPADGPAASLGDRIALDPGAAVVLRVAADAVVRPPRDGDDAGRAKAGAAMPRVAIEAVQPAVDGGRFAVKRVVGTLVEVTADVICDGHDELGAVLRWRPADATDWAELRMRPFGNDRWTASFPLERLGRHVFAVEAWHDAFATFRHGLELKHAAGQVVTLELEEGRRLVAAAAERAGGHAATALAAALVEADDDARLRLLLAPEAATLMAGLDDRPHRARSAEIAVDADRLAAQFASWYELFPRSQGPDRRTHGTFADVIGQLPRVRAMGFDVLYFPPIHPIGTSNRKGPNNTLIPGPDDVGSPYAIGSPEGGHDAIHPRLGTLEDFRALVRAAAEHGIELALDFAIQCSPDHPWLREHRDWFDWRPDGSLRYAENPPKKYQDIVNVDFHAAGSVPALWLALRDVVRFWADEGVRLFRVDNPHTKPLPFWEWLIADIRAAYPDAVFLAEAFTKPKMMYRLAKAGFGQSYTYFTWRNEKREIMEYMTELTTTAPREFFRPHFFVNTPDINPFFLQTSGRAGHLIRAALAATLAGLWGVYQGFELCEATPLPGREEYLDSEKYQIREWPDRRPGDIVDEITRLNAIRRGNPALHSHLGLAFHAAADDRVLWYRRFSPDRSNTLLCTVSLDPQRAVDVEVELPLGEWDLPDGGAIEVEDLMQGGISLWRGRQRRLRLDPQALPFGIWRVRAA